MRTNQSEVTIHERAVLAAVLAAYGDRMPTVVSVALSDAVDALTDPLTAPGFLPSHDPAVADPRAAVRTARDRLTIAAATGSVGHALACGRAARAIAEAEAAWPGSAT